VRFKRLDLNLLVALDALLSERSVSLAADRICLSQSATSSALSRLREYFGDELLVVKGRQMVLTARAEQLVEPVRAVLEQIRANISVNPPFDPATSDRTIRIMASDYASEVLLASALNEVLRAAPNMRFDVMQMNDAAEALERGTIDLLLTIDHAIVREHPSQMLFEDDHVVVGWSQNPAMRGEMTRDSYYEMGHVTVRFFKGRVPAFEDWFMQQKAQQRRVEIVAPSFLTVPTFIVGSNRIATMHRRLAERFVAQGDVVMKPLPFEMPPIRVVAQWHVSNSNDAALRWLVERLLVTVGEKKSPTGSTCKVIPMEQGRSKDRSSGNAQSPYRLDVHPKTK